MSHDNKTRDCVFCKIIAGEIPAHKVYEDEYTYAFLDIVPIREGHTLVIPKKHYDYSENMPDDDFAAMMLVVNKLKKNYKSTFNVPQVGFFVSGWDVPHTHVHVVPMKDSKDITSKPLLDKTAPKFTDTEFERTVRKIRNSLQNQDN